MRRLPSRPNSCLARGEFAGLVVVAGVACIGCETAAGPAEWSEADVWRDADGVEGESGGDSEAVGADEGDDDALVDGETDTSSPCEIGPDGFRPVGPERLVSDSDNNYAEQLQLAVTPGGFAAAWVEDDFTGRTSHISLRTIGSEGTPESRAQALDSSGTRVASPSIAGVDGGLAVTWTVVEPMTESAAMFLPMTSSMAPIGSPIRLDSGTLSSSGVTALDAVGPTYVVGWEMFDASGVTWRLRRLAADGAPAGTEVVAAALLSAGTGVERTLACRPDGECLVAFHDWPDHPIRAALVSAEAFRRRPWMWCPPISCPRTEPRSLAPVRDGYVLAWCGTPPTPTCATMIRRLDRTGAPVGEPVIAGTCLWTCAGQDVAAVGDSVAVVWTDDDQYVYLSMFDADLRPLGADLVVAGPGASHPHDPRIAVQDVEGVVVWADTRRGDGEVLVRAVSVCVP